MNRWPCALGVLGEGLKSKVRGMRSAKKLTICKVLCQEFWSVFVRNQSWRYRGLGILEPGSEQCWQRNQKQQRIKSSRFKKVATEDQIRLEKGYFASRTLSKTKGAGSFHIPRKTMKEMCTLAVLGVREQPNLAQNLVTHRH